MGVLQQQRSTLHLSGRGKGLQWNYPKIIRDEQQVLFIKRIRVVE